MLLIGTVLACLTLSTIVWKKERNSYDKAFAFWSTLMLSGLLAGFVLLIASLMITTHTTDYQQTIKKFDDGEYVHVRADNGEPGFVYRTNTGTKMGSLHDVNIYFYRTNGETKVEKRCPHTPSWIYPFGWDTKGGGTPCDLNFYVHQKLE